MDVKNIAFLLNDIADLLNKLICFVRVAVKRIAPRSPRQYDAGKERKRSSAGLSRMQGSGLYDDADGLYLPVT